MVGQCVQRTPSYPLHRVCWQSEMAGYESWWVLTWANSVAIAAVVAGMDLTEALIIL